MDLDIASLSMNMSQSKTLNQVGTLMLAKTLDTTSSMAASEVQMLSSMPTAQAMENSVNPAIGSNIDVYL